MSDTKNVRAKALRAFTDAGSGRRFAIGETVSIDAGLFVNYRTAGLVEAVENSTATVTSPADPASAAKPGRARS